MKDFEITHKFSVSNFKKQKKSFSTVHSMQVIF